MLVKERPAAYKLSHSFGDHTDLAQNETPRAEDGEWWSPEISRKELKALMKRQNLRPLVDYLSWLALLAGSGVLAYFSLGHGIIWPVLTFLLYGTIYSSCDPRSHDLGHGAAFASRRLNDAFLRLTLFMTLKEPVDWRWRHTRHHTDTIHVGYDPEIIVTRPADLVRIFADFFFLFSAKGELTGILNHALGRVTDDPVYYVPKSEWSKMIWSARLYVAAMLLVLGYCVAIHSAVPLLFIWGPRIYANWLNFFGFLSQHAGLKENAYDHRLNTRTFVMNPALEFLYNNMNYHIEHHLYPLIPYYNLPALHRLIKNQLPHTYSSLAEITGEVVPAVWRQAFEPDYFITRIPPEAAASRQATA
jgi:fatty acid desaturase